MNSANRNIERARYLRQHLEGQFDVGERRQRRGVALRRRWLLFAKHLL